MKFTSKEQARQLTNLTYFGGVNHSAKHEKANKYGELVYSIYLAPSNMSGRNVCAKASKHCIEVCLNESGHNRIDTSNRINRSRIKKTNLLFNQREFTIDWIISEIKTAKNKAQKLGLDFSVRLNNTSDLNPTKFYKEIDGEKRNLLEIFPDVQFYDYTKIFENIALTKDYPNYDLTFSYNGSNMKECIELLNDGERVAMVFLNVPEYYKGFKVIDGDKNDLRYRDEKGVIVGLKYKKVRTPLSPDNKFVIQDNEA